MLTLRGYMTMSEVFDKTSESEAKALGLALSAYPLDVGTSAVICWMDGEIKHGSQVYLTPEMVDLAKKFRNSMRRYN